MSLDVNTTYLGDCLQIMNNIDPGSIDMILCDLPYGTTKNKWDCIIPFDALWDAYLRVLRPTGTVVLTAHQPFTSALIMSKSDIFKYCWIWEKSTVTGVLNAKKQPLRNYEDICIFYKNRNTYNPQGLLPCNKVLIDKYESENYGRKRGLPYLQSQTGYPRQILFFKSEVNNIHPTQKPVPLFEYMIKTYTNTGDTVLDNCAGSGTTGIACLNTDRNYIMIEKEKKYYDIIQDRIANHKLKGIQNNLFDE